MLTITEVNKRYGNIQALTDVSLTIPKGSCYGLVGPNGAGKSTLIKILAAIILDYKGEIHFSNTALHKHSKGRIGYVPQEICLEQNVSALSNLYFFGRLYGLKGRRLRNRADEVLQNIGLTGRGKDKVNTFSGGMKRRLNIGCALLHRPDVIIMDEPTVGIDPQSRHHIFQMIHQLKQAGCTIIYASHYMEEVEQLCDEVAFIDQGKMVENGRIESLLQQYAVPSVYMKGNDCLPTDMEQFGTIAEKTGGHLILTDRPLAAMEKILSHSKHKSCKLDRLELVQPRLEDVFFSLTGNQLRD